MSTLHHVLRAVSATPWAILDAKLVEVLGFLNHRVRSGQLTDAEIRAAIGGDAQPAKASTARGVAVIPLFGVILPRASAIEESSGIASLQRFGAWFDAALNDPGVSAIVIDVDSPGGAVSGVAEMASRILEARGTKPIIAVANTLAASAAYWIATAADELVVSPSAEVGSIGVIAVHLSTAKADEMEGFEYSVLSAGKYKGEGNPYEPLSDDARAAYQERLGDYYGMFVRSVAKQMGVSTDTVRTGFGEGRVVTAQKAVKAGMASRVATLDEVLAKLGGKPRGRRPAATAEFNAIPIAASVTAPAAAGVPQLHLIRVGVSDGPDSDPIEAGRVHVSAEPAADAPTEPAPKAKETPMTAPVTAAPTPGADQQEIEQLRAEKARTKDLLALKATYPEHGAMIDAALGDGRSVQAVKDAIIADQAAKLQARPALQPPTAIARVGAPNEESRPWASFGEFLLAVKTAFTPSCDTDPRLRPLAAATGMNQGTPSEGGFTVLPQFSSVIYEGLTSDPNALLGMTDNYTVEGESLTFPANAETSRATGSRYGGIRGYWINEADQITQSKPKFRQVKVEPQQLAVLVYLTEKLLNNSSAALEQYVTRAATEEITFLVGDAIVNGDGVGKPKGIMAAGGPLITVNKEGSQANTTFLKANANKMWARLHPRSRPNAVWLMNVDVEPTLDDFNTPVKNVAGTENVGGFGSQIYNAEKNTLKGRPIVFCEFCQTLGTTGDIILADLRAYLTGTRGRGVESAMSMHLRFDYAEQAFRFMFEVDGQPWLASALTPFKGSNTLSTFVALQTR